MKKYIIDLSQHNGDVNFKKLKANSNLIDGIYFRIGWSGYAGELHLDKLFTTNKVLGAYKAGFKNIGFYVYVYNRSVESVTNTCEDIYRLLNSFNLLKLVNLPLAFDIEEECYCNESSINVNTNMYIEFKRWFAEKGINTCIYCNEFFARNYIKTKGFNLWLANWNGDTDYNTKSSLDFFGHQFSCTERFEGINSNVDLSYILTENIKPVAVSDAKEHLIYELEAQNNALMKLIDSNNFMIDRLKHLK